MRGIHIQVVKYHLVTYKAMYPTTNYTLGENYAVLYQPFSNMHEFFVISYVLLASLFVEKLKAILVHRLWEP